MDAVTAAKQARDQAVSGVLADILKFPPDHPLLKMWADASWLQAQRFTLTQAHFIDVTDHADFKHLSEEVHGIWVGRHATAQLIESLQTGLKQCREQLEAAPALLKQSEWAEQQAKLIDNTEQNLNAQLQIADDLEVAFILVRNTINLDYSLVVSMAGKQPSPTPETAAATKQSVNDSA
jgi:hypothetical protein